MKKLLLIALLALGLNANSLNIDSNIDGIMIKDQKEKEHILDANIKTVIFASDKGTSDIIKEYLLSLSETEDVLERNSAVYVADISGMPSIISKFIALPKMKKYPFSVLLLDDSNKDYFTKEEGKIIVYSIVDGKVSNIDKISTEEELANFIK